MSDSEGVYEDSDMEVGDEDDEDMLQTSEERRSLHREFRLISEDFNAKKADILNASHGSVKTHIERLNKAFAQAKTTVDAKLDVEVLTTISQIAVQKTEQLVQDGGSFNMDLFLKNLARKLNSDGATGNGIKRKSNVLVDDDDDGAVGSRNWEDMRILADKTFRTAPAIGFLLGPLAIVPKVRNIAKRQAKIVKDKKDFVKPKELQEKDLEEQKNETAATVKLIYTILKSLGKVQFWSFITNPTSYSQTVENLFYCSFLIREGKAQITDENGEAMIACAAPATAEEHLQRSQNIVDLDMKMWREIIELYKITNPQIPTREKTVVDSGKWYA
ncbi:nuclear protein [Nowakowskiella sp. JEL0407]|nr:nuclear protein [Nowakowskiella sp. JEL0407]